MDKACDQNHLHIRQEKVEEVLFPLFDKVTPKNKRVLEILGQALKEGHKDEASRFDTKFSELNELIERTQKRLEAIYEDKIDQKISVETYEKHFKKYNAQKEEAVNEIEKLNKGNKQYYEVGYSIHELAYKAMEIYKNPKVNDEDRRLLLSYAFSKITLKNREVTPTYTLGFEFLANWVPKLNLILEPENILTNKRQKSTFVLSHPVMLPWLDEFRTLDWNSIKSELQFSGILNLYPTFLIMMILMLLLIKI